MKKDLIIMKIAICDNNACMVDLVKRLVEKYEFHEAPTIDTFTDGETLLEKVRVNTSNPYEIIIMDLCLTDIHSEKSEEDLRADGIYYAQSIKKMETDTLLIYMSVYGGFYSDLVQGEPFAFLVKPIRQKELFEVLKRSENRIYSIKNKFYYYTFKGNKFKVNLKEVIYIYSQYRKIFFRLKSREEMYFYEKLDKVESELKEMDAFFIRINKSVIINKFYVDMVYANGDVIVCGEKFTISKKYHDLFYVSNLEDKFF